MEPDALRPTELRYRTAMGDEVITTLVDVDVAALAGGLPVRDFSWHPKQGNYPGWLWTATTNSLVGYESLLERDRVLLADFDPVVASIASQPFWVSGQDGQRLRRHAPDYLLTRRDRSVVIVDVKPARMCAKPEVSVVLEWTGRLCRARGWRYEVFHGEDPIVMSNVRFIAQGRRSMFLDEAVVATVASAGRIGATLGEVEASVRGVEPLDVRTGVLALLWRQVWATDLSRPVSSRSVITAIRQEDDLCPMAS